VDSGINKTYCQQGKAEGHQVHSESYVAERDQTKQFAQQRIKRISATVGNPKRKGCSRKFATITEIHHRIKCGKINAAYQYGQHHAPHCKSPFPFSSSGTKSCTGILFPLLRSFSQPMPSSVFQTVFLHKFYYILLITFNFQRAFKSGYGLILSS